MSSVSTAVETPPFEITGPPHAPLTVVLGGISASRHCCANTHDARAGWWDSIVGPDKAIDIDRDRALSFDYLDGGCDADGRPARIVTTHDQADALAAVLDTLEETPIDTIVGASYGGMVALAFAERYPERVRSLVLIGAAHEPHPMSTALRALQRRVVELGLETDRVRDALSIARGIAMTTYRTPREFGERFASRPDAAGEFEAAQYLQHVGDTFASTWTAARFLALSLSLDLHRVNPANIRARVSLIAPEGDAVVPRVQLEALAALLPNGADLYTLPSRSGHDAFLTEPVALGRILSTILSRNPS